MANSKPENDDKEEIRNLFQLKILILDIETAPIRGYVWDVWNQNIQPSQIISDWFCFTWAAKWLFEKKVYSARLSGKEAIKQDDKRIIGGIWHLLNEADVVIAHNGDKFDIPRINTRFIKNNFHPPAPYQSIDTLKTIRKQFAFAHNKLDFVNQILNLPRKKKNDGQELWNKCYLGDEKSLREMEKYNVQDVRILEDTYLRIRPWIKPHPNCGLFILDEKNFRCPSCGSANLVDLNKMYYTTVNAYEQFRCNDCNAYGRKRVAKLNIKERRFLLSSLPR